LRDKDFLKSKDPQVVSEPFGITLNKKSLFLYKRLFSDPMESLSPQVVAAAKLPILNLNEFDLWKMRIKQYFLMTDYSFSEVILNGDSPTPTRVVNGVVQAVAPTTAESPRDTRNKDTQRRNVPAETYISNALVSHHDGVGSYDWGFQANKEPTNYAIMSFTFSSSSSSDNEVDPCTKACFKAYATLQSYYDKLTNDLRKSQFDILSYKTGLEYVKARLVVYQQNKNVFEEDIKLFESDVSVPTSPMHDRYKSSEGYHVVPPPYTGTFMPTKPDLVFHDAFTISETVPNVFNVEPRTSKPNKDMSQSNRPSAPIIKDWVSDSEGEYEGEPMPA
nr:hypothetical protein [Tanacetum cinerariifolium]